MYESFDVLYDTFSESFNPLNSFENQNVYYCENISWYNFVNLEFLIRIMIIKRSTLKKLLSIITKIFILKTCIYLLIKWKTWLIFAMINFYTIIFDSIYEIMVCFDEHQNFFKIIKKTHGCFYPKVIKSVDDSPYSQFDSNNHCL